MYAEEKLGISFTQRSYIAISVYTFIVGNEMTLPFNLFLEHQKNS